MTTRAEREATQDIADVLVRYATGIDQRQWDLFHSCFTADCAIDYGDIGRWEGADAITAFMIDAHAQMSHTLHRISNVAVTVHGETAVARSYLDGLLMAADRRSGLNPVGYYNDQFVHTADGWKIARRTFVMVHLRAVGGEGT